MSTYIILEERINVDTMEQIVYVTQDKELARSMAQQYANEDEVRIILTEWQDSKELNREFFDSQGDLSIKTLYINNKTGYISDIENSHNTTLRYYRDNKTSELPIITNSKNAEKYLGQVILIEDCWENIVQKMKASYIEEYDLIIE